MAHQIACSDPDIKAAICAETNGVFRVSTPPINIQFTKLLLAPLAAIAKLHSKGPIIIILDALDEHGDSKSRQSVVALMAKEFARLHSGLRFLVTSRAESH